MTRRPLQPWQGGCTMRMRTTLALLATLALSQSGCVTVEIWSSWALPQEGRDLKYLVSPRTQARDGSRVTVELLGIEGHDDGELVIQVPGQGDLDSSEPRGNQPLRSLTYWLRTFRKERREGESRLSCPPLAFSREAEGEVIKLKLHDLRAIHEGARETESSVILLSREFRVKPEYLPEPDYGAPVRMLFATLWTPVMLALDVALTPGILVILALYPTGLLSMI